MEKSKVYFIREINSQNMIKVYKALGKELKGNVAVKVHSGEKGNQNFLHPSFMKDIIDYVKGTVVECNTAYPGARNTSSKHKKLLEDHEWTKYFNVDLLDETGSSILPIPNGKVLKENYVGENLLNYDSMLVLSHFKGHPMGGYGGALKQLSIGCSSSEGKSYIHSAGKTTDQNKAWDDLPSQNTFLEAMADAASSVVNHFKDNLVFINVMANMSVDCDCCEVAEDPCLKDIGILASLDPVAIDKACVDLVKTSNDSGKEHFMERVTSRNGEYTIEAAYDLGIGNINYELIELK